MSCTVTISMSIISRSLFIILYDFKNEIHLLKENTWNPPIIMKGSSTGTASWISRRKIYIIIGLVLFVCLFLFIKEKYFYRSDLLKPILTNTEKGLTEFKVRIEKNQGSILGYVLGFGLSKKENKLVEVNIWDKWIIDHPELTSIGDIYDKCGKYRIWFYKQCGHPFAVDILHCALIVRHTLR